MRFSTLVATLLPAGVLLCAATAGAQPLTPIYSTTLGVAKQISLATTVSPPGGRAAEIAAAIVNTKGEGEILAWHDTTSALAPLGSALLPGTTPSIAITGLDAERVVSASYSGDFTLAVNTWKLGGSSDLERQGGDSTAPAYMGSVAITRLSSTRVAVAFVDPSDCNLFVYAYDISASGVPTQVAAWGVPGVANSTPGLLGIAAINSGMVMTASRDLSGDLQVRTWKITSTSVVDLDSYTAGEASTVAIAAEFGTEEVFTATENSAGDLLSIYWSVSSTGHITRGVQAIGGHASATAAAYAPSGDRLTAVSGSVGDLDVELWQPPFLSSNGEIAHYDTRSPAAQVALAVEGDGPQKGDEVMNYFVTAWRSPAGVLSVEVWQTPQFITPPPP